MRLACDMARCASGDRCPRASRCLRHLCDGEGCAAQTVVGPAYLLTRAGQPFRSAEGLRNRLAKWCTQAGIEGRSAHGIRKAGGQLMALMGATQHEIMAVHGHTQASTSEVYTRGVDRQRLAASAMSKLGGLDW